VTKRAGNGPIFFSETAQIFSGDRNRFARYGRERYVIHAQDYTAEQSGKMPERVRAAMPDRFSAGITMGWSDVADTCEPGVRHGASSRNPAATIFQDQANLEAVCV